MKFFLILGVLWGIIYVVARLYWVVRGRWRRTHAVDVEFAILEHSELSGNLTGLSLAVPFHDEPVPFDVGEKTDEAAAESKPTGTMARFVTEMFAETRLVQVIFADQLLPSREYIYDCGRRPFESRVGHVDGALVYDPAVMNAGAIELGITTGTDAFLLVDDTVSIPDLVDELWNTINHQSDTGTYTVDRLMEIEGVLGHFSHARELWTFILKDERLLRRIRDTFMLWAYRKLFLLNGVPWQDGWSVPSIDDMRPKVPNNTPLDVCLYFEEGDAVGYAKAGKKWNACAAPVRPTHPSWEEESFLSRLMRWTIPEIVADRVYRRKNLFRYGVQYFLTTWYLIGLCSLLFAISEMLHPGVLEFVVGIPFLLLAIMIPVSGVISIWYLLRALFARRRLARPGI